MQDVEATRQVRRYVGLRTCETSSKKQRGKLSSAVGNSVFRAGSHLAGMVIAEWDQVYGTMYAAVVVPWVLYFHCNRC